MSRRERRSRGAAALEFALVLPLLLLLLLGTIEWGLFLVSQTALAHAVGEGARAAAAARPWLDEDPLRFARETTRSSFWPFPLVEDEVEVESLDADGGRPRRVRVRVSQLEWRPVTGFLPASLVPRRLTATALAVLP